MKEGEKTQTTTQLVRRKIYKKINKNRSPKKCFISIGTQNNIFFLKNLLVFHGKKKAIRL